MFDQKFAWLATRMSKTAVADKLRVAWAAVEEIIARVMADEDAVAGDHYANLRRIGIDEISDKRFRDDIVNALTHNLSNGLIESSNTKIRLLTRIAFGFKSVEALIALAMLRHVGGRSCMTSAVTPAPRALICETRS